MDRESLLSKSNISTLCLGYTKFRYAIIQIGTISIETPNRNSQLDIYIKSLSNGYQSQLIIKISIQDLIYQNNIYLSLSFFFWNSCIYNWKKMDGLIDLLLHNEYIYIYIHIYIYNESLADDEKEIYFTFSFFFLFFLI